MPAGQQIAHQWQHEGEHQGDDGCREDGGGGGVDQHLASAISTCSAAASGMTHREMVQNMDELVGQMFLHHPIDGIQGVGKKEGDDAHCYHYRIEELTDDAER